MSVGLSRLAVRRPAGMADADRPLERLGAELGLKVTLGVWLTKDKDSDGRDIPAAKERNEREIRSAIDLARHHALVLFDLRGELARVRRERLVELRVERRPRQRDHSDADGDECDRDRDDRPE